MQAAGVPTASYVRLDATTNLDAALDVFAGQPWVVKRDVLAGGKGVVVTSDRDEAKTFIEFSIKADGYVLLEAFLPGEEASMLVVMDGTAYRTLPASQDHKRAYDNDGPNTGGMGACCLHRWSRPPCMPRWWNESWSPCTLTFQAKQRPIVGCCSSADDRRTRRPLCRRIQRALWRPGMPSPVHWWRPTCTTCSTVLPPTDSQLTEVHDDVALTVVLASEGYCISIKGRQIDDALGDSRRGNTVGRGLISPACPKTMTGISSHQAGEFFLARPKAAIFNPPTTKPTRCFTRSPLKSVPPPHRYWASSHGINHLNLARFYHKQKGD